MYEVLGVCIEFIELVDSGVKKGKAPPQGIILTS